jgi:heavy metal translocating P-type ATPase
MVRPGELVPVDGLVLEGAATLDEAALTGESLPVTRAPGDAVRSGSACAGAAFALRAERTAADSAYSTLVRLVQDAQASRAPFVRMADRYAAVFLPATLALALAAWAAAGDPVRALAVLVVATPCPLILAAPVAIVSGMSRAARAGVVVKDGAAIEGLGGARSLVIDKTGTLTFGEPVVERVVTTDGRDPDELLRLAASVDQVSAHGLAEALVHTAERSGLRLSLPERVVERPGQGVEGVVDGHRVTVGSAAWLTERAVEAVDPAATPPGRARVHVGVDGEPAGTIVLADAIRPDSRAAVAAIRDGGVREIVMATGDRASIAEPVGAEAGVDRVRAGLEPEAKLAVVRELRERLAPVVMVGDGINDAPALALADVGVAMGAAGSTVSAETADAVIVVDRLDRLAEAMRLSRRALRIARQSVLAGMGLSIAAMGVAAAGYLPPLAGALLQEAIDVAVIVNALRVLRG